MLVLSDPLSFNLIYLNPRFGESIKGFSSDALTNKSGALSPEDSPGASSFPLEQFKSKHLARSSTAAAGRIGEALFYVKSLTLTSSSFGKVIFYFFANSNLDAPFSIIPRFFHARRRILRQFFLLNFSLFSDNIRGFFHAIYRVFLGRLNRRFLVFLGVLNRGFKGLF